MTDSRYPATPPPAPADALPPEDDDEPCHAERVAASAAGRAHHASGRARYEQRVIDAEVRLSRCLLLQARRRSIFPLLGKR